MVVTTGPQLNGTWLTWKAFYYPDPSGPKWAYSVPTKAAQQINSAYSLMVEMLAAQFWCLLIGIAIVTMLHRKKNQVNNDVFKTLMPHLWNSKSDLMSAVLNRSIELLGGSIENRAVIISVIVLIVFALYCGQKAMSILVSAKVILGTAAPVNPEAIYVPTPEKDNSLIAATHVLNVPWALRALGTATASIASLSKYVSVSKETLIGTFNGTQEPVYQIAYSYNVTGADMGLQKYPKLVLSVKGSCFTEYNWYQGYSAYENCFYQDIYHPFDNSSRTILSSPLTGGSPMAFFLPGLIGQSGSFPTSNSTWAAIISSVGKASYTAGTDPWYLTELQPTNDTGTAYAVVTGRPALSCWEDSVWSHKGKSASIEHLETLPGIHLSDGMKKVLEHYLTGPMIVSLGIDLGSSNLISGNAALGAIIDANANSFAQDIERLVVAAYVATTNVLTTTTLYPYGASMKVVNRVQNTSGQVDPGVAEFVVWTPEITALNLVVVITIPVLLTVLLLTNGILFWVSPLAKANAVGAAELFSEFVKLHQNSEIVFDSKKHKAKWHHP
ncbi:hypothetical protein CMQ_7387 [Grosmannia clavigera kw1407]|uniref:Uncharacterized protein n=1 Tax=Grosmannia clavigera (strain kw1407 / UAMH 11150) TaxID=655863 RepID=F0XNK4_GROCL|nr:uncharacterized protein CMQ_7387 [Grosmannia clavigera kw1407]EFX00385.1 hypothetical protein CMQ_7387 [Grosmannia clavigera kw1407]